MSTNCSQNEPLDPFNLDLHTRLTVLETRFETIFPMLVAKHDLTSLALGLYDEFKRIHNAPFVLDISAEKMQTVLTSPPSEPRYSDNDSLDMRLIVLETRFDTFLPALATKHDLAVLNMRIQKSVARASTGTC